MNLRLIASKLFTRPLYGKSLATKEENQFLKNMLQYVLFQGIRGDVIEFGVYRGGSLLTMAKVLGGFPKKTLYGLDTFEGHPYYEGNEQHPKGKLLDYYWQLPMERK